MLLQKRADTRGVGISTLRLLLFIVQILGDLENSGFNAY